jgi:hypothetical protein
VQETSVPSDADFFVEWQIADGPDDLIDLSAVEAEVPWTQPVSLPEYLRSTVPTGR